MAKSRFFSSQNEVAGETHFLFHLTVYLGGKNQDFEPLIPKSVAWFAAVETVL